MTNDEWLQEKSARGELTAWLQAERDEGGTESLKNALATTQQELEDTLLDLAIAQRERDEVRDELLTAVRERELYRRKFARALDLAHDIQQLAE